jgi:ABC-type multidrug transport system fused ATPase/permease subunit
LLIVNYPAQEIISTLSLFALGGYRLMPAIQNIYSGISMIKFNRAALDIVIAALTLPRKDKSQQLESRAAIPYQSSISLQNISFSYGSNLPNILNKLNLNINHNEAIGLVGKTGSGKTTLVDLLMGLLTPSNGKIFVDSTQINSSNIQNFQSMIGYVPQYIYLIDASIAANIAFGVTEEHINFDRLEEVCRMANLNKFIESLPEGLNTKVGENGVRLSGGQRQRIGIARALYVQPKILILDEATSSLDGGTENLVMEAINNLASKVTMVIIAHRLDTLKECNNIYLLDQGEIIDSGSYNSLIESNALFQSIAKQDEKKS